MLSRSTGAAGFQIRKIYSLPSISALLQRPEDGPVRGQCGVAKESLVLRSPGRGLNLSALVPVMGGSQASHLTPLNLMVFYEDDLFLVFKIMMYVEMYMQERISPSSSDSVFTVPLFSLWNITTSLKVDCIFSQTF